MFARNVEVMSRIGVQVDADKRCTPRLAPATLKTPGIEQLSLFGQMEAQSDFDAGKMCRKPWAWLLRHVVAIDVTVCPGGFAKDMLGEERAFQWREKRRSLLRAEIDALCFRAYALQRGDVEYVLDALDKVRERDERELGTYRTRALVLDIYDRMQRAIDTGEPYQTLLDPPPADPRVAHPPRETKS
ncbi:hypothetical protein [Polyangium jinanense]|uniref:Uncharacterized protein n=1 Tax=Polyangium jinanense TaxID=2829994 RepID=A0A9X3WYP7_9BACT|nr:hypothetical protein [Polyangium jinanense]MDC3952903.1 hypothetical protein [Polyangium jinanense]MDC3980522.1 hypothetical protein [Polyangium jinanense]